MAENESGAAVEAAPIVTTPAPVVTPLADKTLPPSDEPINPRTRARDSYLARRQAAAAPAVDGSEVPKSSEAAGAPAASDGAGAGQTPAAAAVPKDEGQAAAKPPAGVVRIELAQDDPLRSQGVTHLDVAPEQERVVRALINRESHRRQAETASRQLTEARTQLQQLEQRAVRAEAQLKASTTLRQKLLTDEGIRSEYEEIRASSPAAAERWLRGLELEMQPEVDAEVTKALAESAQGQLDQVAAAFRDEAFAHAAEVYAPVAHMPQFQHVVRRALASYGAVVDMLERQGRPINLDLNAFREEHLKTALLADPEIRQMYRRAWEGHRQQVEAAKVKEAETRAAARATQEGKEREDARLKEAAQRHGTRNPLAQIPPNVRTGAASSTPVEESQDYRGVPASDVKKRQKDRLFGRT